MSEPKPPGRDADGTQILDDLDMVEIEPPKQADPEDAWFVDESAELPNHKRADTLDAFLHDLTGPDREAHKPKPRAPAPPIPAARSIGGALGKPAPAPPAPRVPVPRATPVPARPRRPPTPAPAADDPLELFRPLPTAAAQAVKPAEPPRPVLDDACFQREVEALAAALPTRAALLQAFRARVAVDVTGDAEAAAKLCAKAAELAPDARCVAMTARWIAAARKDVRATIDAARAEIPLAGDATERLALLWQVATLQPPAGAEPTLRQILELDPQDLAAWLQLAASAMQRKAWPVAAEAFDALAGRAEDPIARAAFHASAGGLRDGAMTDQDGARRALDRALEADPTSAGAHSGLQAIYLRTQAPVELARVVWFEAQRVGDLDPGLAYHEHAGDLLWECVRDASGAARSYEQAAALAHSDVVQLGKLASLYEQEGRYPQLAAVYERLLERISDPVRRGAVMHRLGSLYQTRLDRPEEAIRCYRAALDAVPTLAPAAQALAQLHLAHKRWAEAANVLLVEVDRLADVSVRAARYVAIAELLDHQQTGQPASPQVITLLERALALDPAQTAALDALDRMYRTAGRWDDLVKLHEAQLAQTSHALRARALRLALATLYLDRAGAPDKAAEQLRAALAGPPDRFFMLVALARALAEAGKWTEHVAVLEQQAKLVGDGVELVATLYRIATVVEHRLGDPARALAAYRRVLETQPRHELALHAVLRLHRAQSRWEDVIASERRLLELTERPEEAAVILHRIAMVAEDQLARQDDAIEAYESALRHLPAYRPARVALERLLRASGRFDRLATLLEDQAGGATGADRARLLCQAALVRELHCPKQTDRAAKLYEEALAVEAAMPTALWGLHRIRTAAGDWKAVAATLGLLVRQARHDTTRARLLVQLARVHELRLGDAGRAIELLNAALSAAATPTTVFERLRLALSHPDDDAARWLDEAARSTTDANVASGLLRMRATMAEQHAPDTAAEAYARAFAAGGTPAVLEGLARNARGAVLAQALVLRARPIKDAPTRALLLALAGALHDRPDAADSAYREATAAQPDFLPALAGRAALAERAGDWKTAAMLAAEAAAVAVHPTTKVELYEHAAALYIERLGDETSAIAHYRDALAAEPGRRSALERALDLLEQSGDWGQAASLIADQAAALTDDAARAELLARRARILAERLGDADGAIADLDRALVLRPGNPELLGLLAGLHEALAHWADAARVYEQLAQDGELAHRLAALVAQARIWTAEVPDYARAQRLLEAARELEPGDRRVLASLADIAGKAGDAARAAELYGELAAIGRPVERVTALLAAVELRRRTGGDPDTALAAGFALAFEDPAVIPLLEDHYRFHDDMAGFVAAAEAALGRSPSTPQAAPLRVALGTLYAREHAPPERAIPYLRAAVAAAADDPRLRVALAGALAGHDDAAALAELRRAIELDPTDAAAYQRIATICSRLRMDIAAHLAGSAAALLGDDDAQARAHAAILANTLPAAIESPVAGALPPEDALAITVGATRAPDVRRVVLHLDPYLHVIFPEAQRALAAVAPVPDRYPAVGAIRALAAALAVPQVGLYWRERSEPTLFATEPRAFVVSPEHVADDMVARLRFDAGGAFARLAGGSSLGYAAPAAEVRDLLGALDDPDADDEHDFRRRVDKALPRRARKELERLVAEVSLEANAIATWEREEQTRATRIGIITSADLRGVARSVCPDALAAHGGDHRRARIRANARMVEALRFAISDACWAACKRLYGRS